MLAERDRLVASGHDAGPETIRWHLQRAGTTVLPGVDRADPDPSRPGGPGTEEEAQERLLRFQAEQPNETWQSDSTHVRLADGTDVEVITWSTATPGCALHVSAHPKITGPIVLATFSTAVAEHGCPHPP